MGEKHWTVEENNNYDPPWVIRYDPMPGGTKNEDGTTTISVTFPALHVTGWVSEPETALGQIATALNRDALFNEAVEALEPFAAVAENDIGETEADADRFIPMRSYNRAPQITVGDMRRARAVLAKAREVGK